jgi:hypothetical protein
VTHDPERFFDRLRRHKAVTTTESVAQLVQQLRALIPVGNVYLGPSRDVLLDERAARWVVELVQLCKEGNG